MVSVIGSFLWVALLALSWLSNDVNSFVAHMSYPRSFVSSPLWLAKKNPTNDDAAGLPPPPANSSAMVLPDLYSTKSLSPSTAEDRRKMNLMWCTPDYCKDVVRERVGKHNQIVLNGPATGQVAYKWGKYTSGSTSTASVLMLVKPGNEDLMEIAANAVSELLEKGGIQVLLHPEVAAKLTHYYGVRDEGISLFEPKLPPDLKRDQNGELIPGETYTNSQPDLIVTLGGDGLLMHASMLFQGAVPPIISIAGGSLGFLTPFSKEEMVDAIQVALGVVQDRDADDEDQQIFPPNMPSYPYEPLIQPPHALNSDVPKFSFGLGDAICLSIRMRLDCRILNKEGTVTARFNVLNEVVIDRGSSPYLANLECFVDDLHLTTVQADGIVFATPTGSTAYSMSAGGSVVHPAVPCILVTPICPHVLSFRSMVFPDSVVLRCYVPKDARSPAAIAFDGKYRRELQRGDSVQIGMSAFPVPTINRGDHSSDWLESLKRSFNFNARPRQNPL